MQALLALNNIMGLSYVMKLEALQNGIVSIILNALENTKANEYHIANLYIICLMLIYKIVYKWNSNSGQFKLDYDKSIKPFLEFVCTCLCKPLPSENKLKLKQE